jgi:hypothetical protein
MEQLYLRKSGEQVVILVLVRFDQVDVTHAWLCMTADYLHTGGYAALDLLQCDERGHRVRDINRDMVMSHLQYYSL